MKLKWHRRTPNKPVTWSWNIFCRCMYLQNIKLLHVCLKLRNSVLLYSITKMLYLILIGNTVSGTALKSNICGSGASDKIVTSTGQYMTLRFTSDAVNQSVGFEAAYFSATDLCKLFVSLFFILNLE